MLLLVQLLMLLPLLLVLPLLLLSLILVLLLLESPFGVVIATAVFVAAVDAVDSASAGVVCAAATVRFSILLFPSFPLLLMFEYSLLKLIWS